MPAFVVRLPFSSLLLSSTGTRGACKHACNQFVIKKIQIIMRIGLFYRFSLLLPTTVPHRYSGPTKTRKRSSSRSKTLQSSNCRKRT